MQQKELYEEEVIDLHDIWQKLVEYKKIFWSVFLTIFIIGSTLICIIPQKYTFSQVIYLARSPDEQGENILTLTFKDYTLKIQKLFIDRAVRAYNRTADKKIHANAIKILIQETGDNSLLLSIDGSLKNQQIYKFIFNFIIQDLANYTKETVEYRKNNFIETKASLEHRLQTIDDFYRSATNKYYTQSEHNSKNKLSFIENKIVSMYLNDQNLLMNQLVKNITTLKNQIANTYNTKIGSDLLISDEAIGSSKAVLMILAAFIALFFAGIGVFMVNFVVNLHRTRE